MSCLARDKPGLIDHFKKTSLAKKKEMQACRLQTWMRVWTLEKKSACLRSRKKMRCDRSTGSRFGRKRHAQARSRNADRGSARLRYLRLTLIGCPKQAASPLGHQIQANKALKCTLGCGQAAAYPQDAMCRTPFIEDQPFFFQHRCRLDTILVPRVLCAVNC
jgi:hypothetical protein